MFEFDAGDLGRKKFASQRFAIEDGTHLVTVYGDTPIRELAGRTFRTPVSSGSFTVIPASMMRGAPRTTIESGDLS